MTKKSLKSIGCTVPPPPWKDNIALNALGRSMLEMLGVLALMAILSLVGVYMLQRSMLVHRTNQLVEDMRLAGMVVLDGLYDDLTTQEMSIKGHFEQQTPYNFAAAMESDTLNTFYVIAKGVPFDVCVEVKNRKPQWAEQIVANDEQDTCLENQDNDMGFFFNDELTELMDFCTVNSDCGECGKCKNNRCHYGFKNQSGSCFDCDDSALRVNAVDKLECNKCKNRFFDSSASSCVKCITKDFGLYYFDTTADECLRCPNQAYSAAPSGTGVCSYCPGKVDKETGLCDSIDCNVVTNQIGGVDRNTCGRCANRFYVTSPGGRCVKCMTADSPAKSFGFVPYEECVKCPNQVSEVSEGQIGRCKWVEQ